MPNVFSDTENSEAQLKEYYDESPTRMAIKKRRKKHAEKYGLELEPDKEELERKIKESTME